MKIICVLPTLTLRLISLSDPKLRPPEVILTPDTILVQKVSFFFFFHGLIERLRVSLVVD